MTVYRIHIRPKGGNADPVYSFNYCLEKKVLGVGWQTDTHTSGLSWEEYENEATKIYGSSDLSRVKYLKNNIKVDDLLWTRDNNGNYYLARVDSEWEYFTNDKAQKADIVNIVRCKIHKVNSVDAVPGKIVSCFRPTRTIQAIRDETASEYSKYLWNKLDNSYYYTLSKNNLNNVFSLLGSEETENIIFIYLQIKGWLVIPNSRKLDTMGYEFYLINKQTKERGIVQVKTGDVEIDTKMWDSWKETVFLFQSNGIYKGLSSKNVFCLDPSEIIKFMNDNIDILPSSIVFWINTVNDK